MQELSTADQHTLGDSVATVRMLLRNNSQILNDRGMAAKEWWLSRDRVDRAIGRIVLEVEAVLGVWDIRYNREGEHE